MSPPPAGPTIGTDQARGSAPLAPALSEQPALSVPPTRSVASSLLSANAADAQLPGNASAAAAAGYARPHGPGASSPKLVTSSPPRARGGPTRATTRAVSVRAAPRRRRPPEQWNPSEQSIPSYCCRSSSRKPSQAAARAQDHDLLRRRGRVCGLKTVERSQRNGRGWARNG
eukprot:766011-Hanusia_phi.AAC.4